MKFVLLRLIFVFISTLSSTRLAMAEDWPLVQTLIELNPVEGAHHYEVEITSNKNDWSSPYKYKVSNANSTLQVRLTPGDYFIKTRSLDLRGHTSTWSSAVPFTVNYKAPQNVYPGNGAVITPLSAQAENLTFQWPQATEAAGYHFVLKDAKGNLIKSERTKNNWLTVSLDVGSIYSWSLNPLTSSEWLASGDPKSELPPYRFEIAQPVANAQPIDIEAKAVPGATKYQFEFVKLDASGKLGNALVIEGQLSELKPRLSPGAYEVRVRSFFADHSTSVWSPPFKFFVPYLQVQTIHPEPKALVESTDDLNSTVEFEWQAQPDVHHYQVYVYDTDGNYLKKFQSTDTRVTGTLPHDQEYMWTAVPYSVDQNEIDPSEFSKKTSKFRITPYRPLRLAASEEPNQIYSWGRYYTSITDYVGKNYDLNSLVNQKIYVNALEAAAGFWHRKSQFGIMAHGGVSGFIIENHLRNFANAGVHLGYRYLSAGGTRIRAWLGATYLEFPEYLRSPYSNYLDFERIKSVGPQLQLSYMDDLDGYPNYGYHLYVIFFQKAKDLATPNGLPQEQHLNYTLGVFGTYRNSDQSKWQLGYAYKNESVEYKSSDRSGLNNSSTISGHYINLSLEWGFGEKMK